MSSAELAELKGVGPAVAKKLEAYGLKNVNDLVLNFPRRYEDYSHVVDIKDLKPGQVSIKAKIVQATGRYVRRGMHITEAVASDDSGSVRIVWFNQPYRASALKKNQEYYISGKYELSRQRFSILNPSAELVSSLPISTARIVPVYRETKDLKSPTLRKILGQIKGQIENIEDNLPTDIVKKHRLLAKAAALKQIHFPEKTKDIEQAKRRLGFEEVFGLSLAALLNKRQNQKETAHKIMFDERLAKKFVAELAYKLTDDQRKVIWQAYLDMQKTVPMNRLVQGDVGSGKTVVAAMAALMAIKNGYQAALMAPTEILARQHAETIHKMLKPLGMENQMVLLVGGMKQSEKKRARASIQDGRAKFLVGTHALITDKVDMHKLGLVIIDEQHRFGVRQRQELLKKAGKMPHMLSMTATPIPRSLALTLYGELDVSVISKKPNNRLPITTKIIPPSSRNELNQSIERQIDKGHQAFIVCPLITDSEILNINSAETVYKKISEREFKHRRVGLLHGRQRADEKEKIMKDFAQKKIDILVSTTVVEVGVDVPNATVMVIEGAERFGLAQIHQLRGRVGRGDEQGYCYLVPSEAKTSTYRLEALTRSSDGFMLAELDLELRGPGAIYGQAQHGQLDLRIANLSDTRLISEARQSAQEFIDGEYSLSDYPELKEHVNKYRTITTLN